MKVLITGGNGYVGRTLSRLMCDEVDLCVVDNVRFGSVRFRDDELGRFRFERVDICDFAAISKVFEEFDPEVVVHLAAIHYIPECNRDPQAAISVNVEGTVNLLRLCGKGRRFVFASSGAVYRPDSKAHNEATSLIDPDDVYGHTKLHGEHFVRFFSTSMGFPAVIVRLFNVVGRGETNPHIVPEIFAQLLSGREKIQLGNITSKRDFIHIDDAASGFRAIALGNGTNEATPPIVNLASGVPHSMEDLLALIEKVSGRGIVVESSAGRMRPTDRPFMCADISKIDSLFGWKPRKTLHDAVAKMWIDPDLPDSLLQEYKL
jgi:UDP-glucose 4-epimerase